MAAEQDGARAPQDDMPTGSYNAHLLDSYPHLLAGTYARFIDERELSAQHTVLLSLAEALIKYAAAAALGQYLGLEVTDATISQAVLELRRPSLGHWAGLLRAVLHWRARQSLDEAAFVLPELARLYSRRSDELPSGAALVRQLQGGGLTTLAARQLFDLLVAHRNDAAHGAGLSKEAYTRLVPALQAALEEVLLAVPSLVERELRYVETITVQAGDSRTLTYLRLMSDRPRLRPQAVTLTAGAAHPLPQRLHVATPEAPEGVDLHPLLVFVPHCTVCHDPQIGVFNGFAGRTPEYLCYACGHSQPLPALAEEVEAFLAHFAVSTGPPTYRLGGQSEQAAAWPVVAAEPGPAGRATTGEPAELRTNNLPVPPTPLMGRAGEVAECGALLRRDDVWEVTLTGPGGIGKTRLALEVAMSLLPHFPDGVFYVPLATITDSRLVAPAIAQTLNVRETSTRPLLESLLEYLHDKQMLLVLDNVEQVEAAPLIGELLEHSHQLKILAASRTRLRVRGEQEYPVPPLTLPDARRLPPPDALLQYGAVALFVERAAAVNPAFALTAENAAAVVESCRRLDGLPLALELAAARIKILSPQALLERLAGTAGRSPLQLLTGGAHDLPTRQQTMRGTIEWSLNLLDESAQRLFARLAVFAGSFTIDTAEAVCNPPGLPRVEVLDGAEALLDNSLIRPAPLGPAGERRFVLLETIREYGAERLSVSGEAAAVRRQYAGFFLDLAEREETRLLGREQQAALQRLETEHDNLSAALAWAIQEGVADVALRLVGSLWRFWYIHGYFTEGRRWLTQVLALPGAAGTTPARIKALNGAGNLAYSQGDYAVAQRLHDESLSLSWALDDERGVAAAFNNLGLIARSRGDYSTAHYFFTEALALNRAAGNRGWEAINLNNLGLTLYQQGDYARARALQEESLALFTILRDDWGAAMALGDLGKVVSDLGDYAEAQMLYERSLAVQEKLGDRRGVASAVTALGLIAWRQGDGAKARALCEQGLAIFRDLGDKQGIAGALYALGNVADDEGEYGQARALYEESLALRKELGDVGDIAGSLSALGLIALQQGDHSQAQALLEESLALRREMDDRPGIASALSNLGLLAVSRGDYGAAEALHTESLALAQKLGRKISMAISLINLGFVAHHQGKYSEAHAFYAQSLTLFEELGDKVNSLACLAGLASTTVLAPERPDDALGGAQLLGAVEALSITYHAPLPPYWRPLYESAVAAVRIALGDVAFSQAWAAGQRMTLEQALAAATPQPVAS